MLLLLRLSVKKTQKTIFSNKHKRKTSVVYLKCVAELQHSAQDFTNVQTLGTKRLAWFIKARTVQQERSRLKSHKNSIPRLWNNI